MLSVFWSDAIEWDKTENDQYVPVRVSVVPGMYMCENACMGHDATGHSQESQTNTGFREEFPNVGVYKYLRRWG